MKMFSSIRKRFTRPVTHTIRKAPRRACLGVEALEERACPTTYTVTSDLDAYIPGTLRWAVDQVNANPGADTIVLDSSLSSEILFNFDFPPLMLTDTSGPTTITGPASGLLIGHGSARVYDEVLTVNEGVTATLMNLTLSAGDVKNLGTLSMTNCTITGSRNGPGLFNQGTATLTNCTISYCYGGVGNTGTLTMTDCTIRDNESNSGLINQGTATLTNCTVSGNEGFNADFSGGGVFNDAGGTLSMTSCIVSGNYAIYDNGGGLANRGAATLTNCTISNNLSQVGAGVYNSGSLAMTSCTISTNRASFDYHGLANTGTATLSNCTISGNGLRGGGGGNGGGVGNSGTLTMTNCTVNDNYAPGFGGGLDNGGTLSMTNCTVSGNTGLTAGGGLANRGTATLTNCTVSENSTAGYYDDGEVRFGGGGVFNNNATLILANTIVAKNDAGFARDDDIYGGVTSLGNNLIGTPIFTFIPTNFWLPSDKIGTDASPLDPLLAPLGNYGGPTPTMGLLPGSPALNAGADSVLTILTAAIPSALATSISVANTAGLSAGLYVQIDSEILKITGVNNGTTLTVARGQLGTTAAAHTTTGVNVILAADARGNTRVGAADIGAFESQGFTLTPVPGSTPQLEGLTSFAPLAVTVTANDPSLPVDGGWVAYTAPTSGASAILSSSQTMIAAGIASVSAAPNGTPGQYTVTATTPGATSAASFSLQNVRLSQTITFEPLSSVTVGVGPITLNATSSIGLPVSFRVISGPGSVSGNTLTVTGPGSIVIQAEQAGNAAYLPASAQQTLAVKLTQTITFEPLSPVPVDVGPITLSASSSIGLPVSFRVISGPGSVSGNTLTVTGPGSIVIQAEQAGNADYAAASVQQTLVVNMIPLIVSTNSGVIDNNYVPGQLSLPEAIHLANSSPGPDTITFDANVFGDPETITLGSRLSLTDTTGSTTIMGPEAGVTISGGGVTGVFLVGSNVTASFLNLTITNGTAVGGSGAGLENHGTATLTDCIVSDNTVHSVSTSDSTIQGGGVANFGEITLIDCTISRNSLDLHAFGFAYGAGLLNAGTATLTNCSVTDNSMINSANRPIQTQGGGLFCATGSSTTLNDCIISGNSTSTNSGAQANAGAGLANSGTVTLTGCTISDNSAGTGGGGILNNNTITLIDCTISGNSAAARGGGMLNIATATLTNCTISGNSADNGGGLANNNAATATLTNCTVSGNSAITGGGGLRNASVTSSISLTNTIVAGNTSPTGPDVLSGVVSSTTRVSLGSGYTSAPTVTFSGGGTGAAGQATVQNGQVVFVTITDGGSGYTSLPTITLSGGGGNGAVFTANISNPFVSLGNNLIGNTDGSSGWVASDLTGAADNPLDPLLDALADNGGPTWTMALLPGSPAINAGASGADIPTTDQRGKSRIDDPDIGSHESGHEADTPAPTISFELLADRTYGDADFEISATASSGLPVSFTASGNASVRFDDDSDKWYVHILGAGSATITAHQAGDANYAPATDVTRTLNIHQANATITVVGFSGDYDGVAHGVVSSSALGVETVPDDLSGLLHVESTTYTDAPGGLVHWTFDGDANYNAASGDALVTIKQVSSTVTVSWNDGVSATYDGQQHGATASWSGASTGGPLTVTYVGINGTNYAASTTAPTDAGVYQASASFAGDVNHTGNSGSAEFTIARATASIAVSGYSVEYDGTTHGLSGTATGVGGADLSSFLSYGAGVTDVPGGLVSWSFDAGSNYYYASGSELVDITPATAAIVVSGYSVEYDGTTHTATGSATGVGGADLSASLTLSGTTHTDAGSYTDTWSFHDASGNYQDASGTVDNSISRATLTITANNDTKTYGVLKTFSSTAFTQTGLVTAAGDTITGVTETSTGAAASATPGTYAIVPSAATGTGLSNYDINYVNGTLTVVDLTITVPAAQTAYEDVDKAISGVRIGGGEATVTVLLTVSHGTLRLGTTNGVTSITGAGTGSLTLSGSIFEVNAALASLVYRGSLNYTGNDTLSITHIGSLSALPTSVAISVVSATQQAAELQAQVRAFQAKRILGRDRSPGRFAWLRPMFRNWRRLLGVWSRRYDNQSRILNQRRANSLIVKLTLKGNNGDVGKVQAFLKEVAAYRNNGILTQEEAGALLRGGNVLLLSVTRR